MNKTSKKLVIALVAIILAIIVAVTALLVIKPKKNNDKWSLDGEILTVSCEGSMESWESEIPWEDKKPEIKEVVIENGTTGICTDAFSNCVQLTKVTMADTVNEIGDSAFSGCSSLKDLKLSANLEKIGNESFCKCSSLKEVLLPVTVKEVGKHAFSECRDLVIKTELTEIPDDWAEDWCDDTVEIVLDSSETQEVFLTAEKADFDEFVQLAMCFREMSDYDYNDPKTLDACYPRFTNNNSNFVLYCSEKYNIGEIAQYFYSDGHDDVNNCWKYSVTDPLKKLTNYYTYIKIDADKVDWIIRNIMNAEPNHNIKSDEMYYYDGHYYYASGDSDGFIPVPDVVTHEQLEDGKYKITVSYSPGNDDGGYYANISYECIAALKEIDGQKVWSMYNFKTIGSPNW